MSRRLADLCPTIRPQVNALLLNSVEQRLFVLIVDTLRTTQEQDAYLAQGTSWVSRSKHLSQRHCPVCGDWYNSTGAKGLSHAIDLCPLLEYHERGSNKLNWSADNPTWEEIGKLAELYGLGWGGRWRQKDLGHIESETPYMGVGRPT